MKKKRLAILLSPRTVSATIIGAPGSSNTATAPIPADEQLSLWDGALTSADAALQNVVTELNAAGADAVAIYHSPTAFSDVFHCSTRGAAFSNAARLALADRLPFDAANAQLGINPWGADSAKQDKRSHAIIAADTLPTATTVASWIERAGLTLVHAAPVNAAAFAWMLDHLESIDTPTPTACLHIGEECSVLGFASANHTLLVRRIALTKADLLNALQRPIMSGDESTQTNLDEDTALQILMDHGIPAPNAQITDAILGRNILPLLQPLLQRFVVETRQLFRFGVEQGDRESAALRISGPGAQIPNLANIISEQLEIKLDDSPADNNTQTTDLDFCESDWRSTPNLVPPAARAQIERTTFKKTLIAGCAIAAVVAAIDAGLTLKSTAAINADADAIASQAISAESLLMRKAEAQATQTKIATYRQAALEHLSPRADWAGILKEISTLTPDWVRLSSFSTSRTDTQLKIHIDGHALQNDPAVAPQIEMFIDSLKDSPLIAEVSLGATQATVLDMDDAIRFSLELEAVAYPPTLAAAWENAQ